MTKLLYLTAGQLLILFIGLTILLNILDIVFSPSANFSFYFVAPVINIVGLALLYSWFWTIGVNLFEILPKDVKMNLTRFKYFLLLSFCLFVLVVSLQTLLLEALVDDQPHDWIFLIFLPHILAIPCILYCINFIAKALKACELNRSVIFNDYSSEFLMLLFFPLAIWFIQPRIKKLFESRQEFTAN